jgi:hypothetical protein
MNISITDLFCTDLMFTSSLSILQNILKSNFFVDLFLWSRCLAYRDDGIGSRRKRPEHCRRCARRGSLQRMMKAAVRQVDENAAVSGVMQLPPASQLAWRRCRLMKKSPSPL